MDRSSPPRTQTDTSRYPLTLAVDRLACMLNFELADDPTYEAGELQWFDDEVHGTGMLAFLSRREDRRVDYYAQRGLTLDRAGYELAGGTGTWTEIDFDRARLDVADDGVVADARFVDVEGREIEIRVDDRDGASRRAGGLLAPVGASIERPNSLLLVWMPAFDLVRVTGRPPVILIGGREASTGRLPGVRLHRRHLIKYAAPVITIQINRTDAGDPGSRPAPRGGLSVGREPLSELIAEHAGHRALLVFNPSLPDVATLVEDEVEEGRWHVGVDGTRLTGGTWRAARVGDRVDLGMDVDERWRPGRLPWLMRLVITVVPVFRRWPTTYRWRAEVHLGPTATMSSRWERTTIDVARSYRRATGSS